MDDRFLGDAVPTGRRRASYLAAIRTAGLRAPLSSLCCFDALSELHVLDTVDLLAALGQEPREAVLGLHRVRVLAAGVRVERNIEAVLDERHGELCGGVLVEKVIDFV